MVSFNSQFAVSYSTETRTTEEKERKELYNQLETRIVQECQRLQEFHSSDMTDKMAQLTDLIEASKQALSQVKLETLDALDTKLQSQQTLLYQLSTQQTQQNTEKSIQIKGLLSVLSAFKNSIVKKSTVECLFDELRDVKGQLEKLKKTAKTYHTLVL